MKKTWAKCSKCNKEFTYDEWYSEVEIISNGWTWDEVHSDKYCNPEEVGKMKKVYILPEQLDAYENGERIIASSKKIYNDDIEISVRDNEVAELTSCDGIIMITKKGGFTSEDIPTHD